MRSLATSRRLSQVGSKPSNATRSSSSVYKRRRVPLFTSPHHRRRPPPLKRTLQCFWLLSYCNPDAAGVKFLLVTEPAAINQESVLHSIYELYCDYVLKNPFYQAQSRRR